MGRVRLQVIVALVTILGLVGALGYVAFSVNRVTVPEVGGSYVEGIAGTPQTINPIFSQANPVDQDLVALIYSGLTRVDDRGSLQPDLAESWEISPDGRVYTFRLRPEVFWHDGAPFTADDVLYTVQAIQHPDYQGTAFLTDMWRTVSVESLDDHTVRFTLREPFAPFMDFTSMGILPVHILGAVPVGELTASPFNGDPVGTGPYRVTEVTARHVVLEANPDYYLGKAYVEQLEFRFYPDTPSVFAARERGEIQGIARVLPEYLDVVENDRELTIYSAPVAGYNAIILNLDRPVFQDPDVRRAMMLALDRQKLVDSVVRGQGIVINSPILPYSWAYDPDVRTYPHDPKKARTVLEEAGWYDQDGDGVREQGPFRLEFSLVTNEEDAVRSELVAVISKQLAQVGIQANPTLVPWETLVSDQLRLRRFDAVLTGWQRLPPDPDPYPYWHSSQAQEDGFNFSNYVSAEADGLLAAARSTVDVKERTALYYEFQAVFADEVPSLLLYQPVYTYAVDSAVQGVQLGTMIDSGDRFRNISSWYMSTQRMLYSEAREEGVSLSR